MMGLLLLSGCGSPEPAGLSEPPPPAEADRRALFRDVSTPAGLDFRHHNGMTGELYFAEIFGAGAAMLDYDGDGDLDLFLPQGHTLGSGEEPRPEAQGMEARGRLFENLLGAEGKLRFQDVTDASGLDARGYGMGVAVGDFHNDGHPDLYLANFGPDQLWRNRGDGTFEDVTATAGIDDPLWSTSAAALDYDGDGWLDLYVVHYTDFSLATHKPCQNSAGRPDYCGPASYRGVADRLLRNRGDGTFEDVTVAAGLADLREPGLGVVAADLDGDGPIDLYVANDMRPNQLWHNRGDGTFEDRSLLAGTAVNFDGQAEASMGVDAGDLDLDGDLDLFMTHLDGETNTLYLNDGDGLFRDGTATSALGLASVPFTSFGTALVDYDGDGWLDVVTVSGAVKILESQARAGDELPLKQPNQLFRNRGGGQFEDVSAGAGPGFTTAEVSRGTAVGDLDNDGDPDLLISNNHGPARLLKNSRHPGETWLGVRLVLPEAGGRDALGAEIRMVLDDGRVLLGRARTDGSYLSANDPRVLFAPGKSRIESCEVRWPDGLRELFPAPPAGTYTTLARGTGTGTDTATEEAP
ncbi:MAG: CRTAC1 family protein [Acidobacteriota bacterium]|nr:CRTAC1 family protein [Acidobacteriota bacterium]